VSRSAQDEIRAAGLEQVSELAQAEHEPSSLGSVTAEGGGSVLLIAAKGCAVTSLARTDDDERRSHGGLANRSR
jgi:hypothetical protein